MAITIGLVSDDSRARPDRLSVWRDFNNAWLGLLQRQKDMVESHEQLGQSQSLLPPEGLKSMGDTLVEMCNVLANHGLVDYEQGVWEERIVDSKSRRTPLMETVTDFFAFSSSSGVHGSLRTA